VHYIEGITYGNNVINPISPNSTNGSFSAGFGSASPGWYKDASGIVHLVGAAKQVSTGGSNPNLGGIGTHPEDVTHMKRTADHLFGVDYRWSVLGAGRNQLPIAALAASMGGNIRVGLEDSLWIAPGELAVSNAAQVRRACQIVEGLGLEVATPNDAREILSPKEADKVAF
jgi:hypothetical protein